MTGAYVGDGMPPVPEKLVNKIRRWEFMEMGELLPEFWVGPKEVEGEPGKEKWLRQGRKVTEIFAWLQCFGTYVAVLSTHEPAVVPEMMAYMGIIILVSQDYEGLGWVRYDLPFGGRQPYLAIGSGRQSMALSSLRTSPGGHQTQSGASCVLPQCIASESVLRTAIRTRTLETG